MAVSFMIMTTDQKVLGLNPNAVTQKRKGFHENEALFYFGNSGTVPTQFDCKGDFEFSLQHPNLYS